MLVPRDLIKAMLLIDLTKNRANEYSPSPPTMRGRVCRRTRRARNCWITMAEPVVRESFMNLITALL